MEPQESPSTNPRPTCQCYVCGAGTNSRCSKCMIVLYCTRQCQLNDWPRHKIECALTVRQRKFIECAHQRVAGNILIMIAHRLGTCKITARIDETIEEFIKDSSLHFAHLSAAPHTDYVVTYSLQNFTYSIRIDPGTIDLEALKKRYPDPGADWTVYFEM